VVSLSLPDPAAHARPLAAAAHVLLGPAGAVLITVGALLSIYGYLAGAMINTPRLTYAMAEQGEFPRPFGWVHRAYRTPHVSILVFAGLVMALALSGSFIQNLTLSAVSRLATYGLVCLAVPVLRRKKDAPPAAFRLPFGWAFAAVGIAFSLLLATRTTSREGVVLAGVAAAAARHWWLARRTRAAAGA
jgi:amino acid transporter